MPYKKTKPQFFDSYAEEFDALYTRRGSPWHRLVNKFFRQSSLLCYQKTLVSCRPLEGKTVLDVGCGPGHYAVALAQGGARRVLGIDISPEMIARAQKHAQSAGVEKHCEFQVADFLDSPLAEKFDYAVAQGFIDYVPAPEQTIAKILAHTGKKAFFSFPRSDGFLAWQRKIRYRWKCDLFQYNRGQLNAFFAPWKNKNVEIELLSRDYFVTVHLQ
jgi:2-polyprenyl-3-methyl-5-hydroxy-6-metoxy-1,4-benzoquinol methylase